MLKQGAFFVAWLLIAALAASAAGCDDEGGGGAPTGTLETMEATATAETDTPTPAPDIRQQDLTQEAGLRDFLATSGGEVAPAAIIYVDLTGDGVEEAVVPVASGGEGSAIAVFVFGYGPGGLEELLRVIPESGSVKENIVEGALTTMEPVFASGDPLCCPSELRTITYRWDGSRLVVADERTEPVVEN